MHALGAGLVSGSQVRGQQGYLTEACNRGLMRLRIAYIIHILTQHDKTSVGCLLPDVGGHTIRETDVPSRWWEIEFLLGRIGGCLRVFVVPITAINCSLGQVSTTRISCLRDQPSPSSLSSPSSS